MSSQKTSDKSSPRKRSPRKQVRWPVKKTSDGKRQTSKPQTSNAGTQRTLQHFFSKQREKSETTTALQNNGSQNAPLEIFDSSDDDVVEEKFEDKRRVVKNLFNFSPDVNGPVGTDGEMKILKIESIQEPGPQSTQIPQGVVLSPIKEPNIDFHRDDTDEIMGALPDIKPEKKRIWTPEADTFAKILEETLQYNLFCEDDLNLLRNFKEINKQTQDICLRLYQRKHQWIPRSRITYAVEDIEASLAEAVAKGFLDDKSKVDDLDLVLNLLPLKDASALARKFCDHKSSTKSGAVEALLAHSKRKDVLFGSQRIRLSILRGAQELLEQCYFVVPRFAETVTRVLTLFSLGSHFDTFSSAVDRNDHGCCHLFTIGQYLKGAFTFPEHETQALFEHIFKTPQDFMLYSDARVRNSHVYKAVESNRFDEAMEKFEKNFDWFVLNYTTQKFEEDANLPLYLHRFTFTYCFLRFLITGAEIFERQRRYEDAVDLYFTVLSQTSFMHNRRGLHWNRLLLDVDAHLKKPHNSLALAHIALRDSIYDQQKYDILNRAKRISERFQVKTSLPKFVVAAEAPIEHISGKLMQRAIIGRRNVFASVDANGERVVGPEEVAIQHYLNEGFSRGVHGETPTMLMLFALVSWDIIFSSPSETVPVATSPEKYVALVESTEAEVIKEVFSIDLEETEEEQKPTTRKRKRGQPKKKKNDFRAVKPLEHGVRFYKPVEFPSVTPASKSQDFRQTVYVSEFQSGPLDLGYKEFYHNRRRAVDDFLELLSQMTTDQIISTASNNYESHNQKVNPLFSWEVLTKEEAETLLSCIPVGTLVGIFRQLLTDFRFYRSGFPDIIMWNEQIRKWKVIEVKGPGDTLSTKQRYWMHLLMSLGVDCVTCRVASVHNKKIEPKTAD
ncbi:fanconi-associated nuclease 1-like [Galendromus occidentalis]|uniref:Fanconi-associated nuclease n=1 Tax=Galendromus occidentalis TaxID=34638 RepID=A0AAJ6QRH6_9ACAR|nr:fanconi-associated nuclease 1-like [Galendromus occidentalis]